MEEQAPSVEAQVNRMVQNGVKFHTINKEDAKVFLTQSNFFFKVKAFDKNFDKYEEASNPLFGKYVNLDFAYLIDLSRKDALFRGAVLELALNLEHFMKVAVNRVLMESGIRTDSLIADFLQFSYEKSLERVREQMGSEISMEAFKSLASLYVEIAPVECGCDWGQDREGASLLVKVRTLADLACGGIDPDHIKNSFRHAGSSFYSRKLFEKYGTVASMEPWHFMEMASFRDFISFYKYLFFDSDFKDQLMRGTVSSRDAHIAKRIKRLLFPAKTLRNAAAHNDCVLNALNKRMAKPISEIRKYLDEQCSLTKELVDRSWQVSACHDFAALLICCDLIVPNGETRQRAAGEMSGLLRSLKKNMDYYDRQEDVSNALQFLIVLVECFSSRWA